MQRILSDIQTNLLQVEDVTSSNMMLAHAHYVYVLKEFLPDRKPQRKTQNAGSRRQSEDTDDSAQSLDRDSENSETGQGDFLDQYQPTAPSTVHDFSEY